MKRIVILGALAALIFLAGCQTTSLAAMKPGATLLVVPLDNEKETGVTPFGSYYAVITRKDSGEKVEQVRLNPSDEYALEKKLSPGDYYISQTYFQFTNSGETPDSERKFYEEDFAPFTMAEGKITLCPVVFSTETTKGSGFKLPVTMDLTVFKDKGSKRGERELQLLNEKYPKEFSTWEISE